jgi:hypothetical protein
MSVADLVLYLGHDCFQPCEVRRDLGLDCGYLFGRHTEAPRTVNPFSLTSLVALGLAATATATPIARLPLTTLVHQKFVLSQKTCWPTVHA